MFFYKKIFKIEKARKKKEFIVRYFYKVKVSGGEFFEKREYQIFKII